MVMELFLAGSDGGRVGGSVGGTVWKEDFRIVGLLLVGSGGGVSEPIMGEPPALAATHSGLSKGFEDFGGSAGIFGLLALLPLLLLLIVLDRENCCEGLFEADAGADIGATGGKLFLGVLFCTARDAFTAAPIFAGEVASVSCLVVRTEVVLTSVMLFSRLSVCGSDFLLDIKVPIFEFLIFPNHLSFPSSFEVLLSL